MHLQDLHTIYLNFAGRKGISDSAVLPISHFRRLPKLKKIHIAISETDVIDNTVTSLAAFVESPTLEFFAVDMSGRMATLVA